MNNNIAYLKKYGDPSKFEENIRRLEAGEPVQYIVGNVNFYGYQFIVNPSVLIPRFETEELVEKTIKYAKQLHLEHSRILDLGTGSGCIAITLAKKLEDSSITAVDISKEVLEVAKQNAIQNNVVIEFLKSDMLENVMGKYDIIISNPPYIDVDETIDEIVRRNEPSLALFADNHGLYYYDIILKQARDYLNETSIIAFEIGNSQGKEILDIAKRYFPNAIIKLEQDLQKRDRFVFVINAK